MDFVLLGLDGLGLVGLLGRLEPLGLLEPLGRSRAGPPLGRSFIFDAPCAGVLPGDVPGGFAGRRRGTRAAATPLDGGFAGSRRLVVRVPTFGSTRGGLGSGRGRLGRGAGFRLRVGVDRGRAGLHASCGGLTVFRPSFEFTASGLAAGRFR
ncbi:MAG: hypothetical protein ACE5GX_11610 [Thermoanaerobaculia bacterium]